MFSVFRSSHPRNPTAQIARALAGCGLPPGMEPSTLSIVQQRGSYSGRKVDYFRAFDPIRVRERGLQIRNYTDLDAHPDLVLGSGHVEPDGLVVASVNRATGITEEVPDRSQADRSAHADDEEVVFPTHQS